MKHNQKLAVGESEVMCKFFTVKGGQDMKN